MLRGARRGDARLVEEDVPPLEPLPRLDLEVIPHLHLGPHLLEGLEVGIDPPPSYYIAPRGRKGHTPEPSQEGAGQEDRGALRRLRTIHPANTRRS